ncbi:MAG: proline--tRNA ligase [Alphaproteobacteria bacterium]|nr:proline--tRNA ligase [Alphaproteobacteria bacterium]MBN2675461.1 proline--tRNA ligase [Alphaproteobacteria bacterium]
MKTAITPTRSENFSEWYQSLIVASDLAENSPVRGCMTIKPYGWAIWELMREEMDRRIKAAGVQNANFPLLIPIEFFNKEAEHVAGFAKECAVVTHHRLKMIDGQLQPDPDSKLTEPYIIRPTSETIIGDAMSRWVQSHRDLPLKLNQWVNVMRWEMRPRMFLRTSEFNWQEGHNVFATHKEANEDARKMHKIYGEYMREVLAIESIMGEKTEEERFAGADKTYTVEQIMQDGKALQAGTSHDLGQHFAKSFNIKFLGTSGKLETAWTTSWGTSTRMMGSLLMVHSDDDGLILPPMVAPHQIVIIPIVRDDDTLVMNNFSQEIGEKLRAKGIRVLVDTSDMRSADKIWKWIKRGVPLRIEIGAREMLNNNLTITRRDIGRDSKQTISVDELLNSASDLLNTIQKDMLSVVQERNKILITDVADLNKLDKYLTDGKIGFFRVNYEQTLDKKFDDLMEKHKISRRCLDDKDPSYVFVAKSY